MSYCQYQQMDEFFMPAHGILDDAACAKAVCAEEAADLSTKQTACQRRRRMVGRGSASAAPKKFFDSPRTSCHDGLTFAELTPVAFLSAVIRNTSLRLFGIA
jgi:hypothetical protein